MKYLKTFFYTIYIYGLIGWLYIAAIALIHPYTLHLPLTHLTGWPREDTFGIICFGSSLVSFYFFHLLQDK